MLAHLLSSAVRSLAVTVVFGSILIYATGGLDSPNARAMVGVIAVCFFLLWITFFFLFGPRVPKPDRRSAQTEVEGGSMSWARGPGRDHGERGDGDGDAGGGDGGGD